MFKIEHKIDIKLIEPPNASADWLPELISSQYSTNWDMIPRGAGYGFALNFSCFNFSKSFSDILTITFVSVISIAPAFNNDTVTRLTRIAAHRSASSSFFALYCSFASAERFLNLFDIYFEWSCWISEQGKCIVSFLQVRLLCLPSRIDICTEKKIRGSSRALRRSGRDQPPLTAETWSVQLKVRNPAPSRLASRSSRCQCHASLLSARQRASAAPPG